MWVKNANTVGAPMAWTFASSYAASLDYAGHTDWRLGKTTPNELNTLGWYNGIYDGTWEGLSFSPFTGLYSWYYWSGTDIDESNAYSVYLAGGGYAGDVKAESKNAGNYVWCCRDA